MNIINRLRTTAGRLAIFGTLAFGAVSTVAISVHATNPANITSPQSVENVLASGEFTRKAKRLSGSYEVLYRDGQTIIRFADNFNASSGPDLKVFLSPQTIETAKGSNATTGSILLDFVKSSRGLQEYIVPAHIDITQFNSVLIHCQAYSVLWGGGNI